MSSLTSLPLLTCLLRSREAPPSSLTYLLTCMLNHSLPLALADITNNPAFPTYLLTYLHIHLHTYCYLLTCWRCECPHPHHLLTYLLAYSLTYFHNYLLTYLISPRANITWYYLHISLLTWLHSTGWWRVKPLPRNVLTYLLPTYLLNYPPTCGCQERPAPAIYLPTYSLMHTYLLT